jgi:hypothetical protein
LIDSHSDFQRESCSFDDAIVTSSIIEQELPILISYADYRKDAQRWHEESELKEKQLQLSIFCAVIRLIIYLEYWKATINNY